MPTHHKGYFSDKTSCGYYLSVSVTDSNPLKTTCENCKRTNRWFIARHC